jgi:hypothetical protein
MAIPAETQERRRRGPEPEAAPPSLDGYFFIWTTEAFFWSSG